MALGPLSVDPSDFDALGVMTEVVMALRTSAFDRAADSSAEVSAPPGRHRVTVGARGGGHVVLGVRYDELTLSRRNVVAAALDRRGWDLDADTEGASRRFPPGTDAGTVAVEVLTALTVGGTPADVRTITYDDV